MLSSIYIVEDTFVYLLQQMGNVSSLFLQPEICLESPSTNSNNDLEYVARSSTEIFSSAMVSTYGHQTIKTRQGVDLTAPSVPASEGECLEHSNNSKNYKSMSQNFGDNPNCLDRCETCRMVSIFSSDLKADMKELEDLQVSTGWFFGEIKGIGNGISGKEAGSPSLFSTNVDKQDDGGSRYGRKKSLRRSRTTLRILNS